MCHGSEGDILTGLPEEPCLQDVDVSLQGDGVNIPELTQETCLCLITDLGSLQESVQGGQGSTVPLLDPAPCPDLLQEGHGGLEHISALGKEGFQLSQVGELTLRIKPAVSQAPAYQGPVLALHGAVVILVPGTGTGEGDVPGMAEAGEMSVHELAPVIRMEGEGMPRVPAETGCQCSDHNHLCVHAYGPRLGPSGGTVGDSEDALVCYPFPVPEARTFYVVLSAVALSIFSFHYKNIS